MWFFCDNLALFHAQNTKTKVLTAQKNLLLECLTLAIMQEKQNWNRMYILVFFCAIHHYYIWNIEIYHIFIKTRGIYFTVHSPRSVKNNFQWYNEETISIIILNNDILAVLGQDYVYTVKYSPPPEGVPEGKRPYKLHCRLSCHRVQKLLHSFPIV